MLLFRRSRLVLIFAACQFAIASAADPVPADDKTAESQPIEIKRGHVASYPRVIIGKITDASDKPVSGALIEWGPDYPHDASREVTHSGEDGTYRLEAKKAGGRFKLGISAAGCSPRWQTGLAPGPRSAPTELNFKLPLETTIGVLIVDEMDLPIPNLEVLPMTPTSGFNSSFSSVQQPEPIPGHNKPIPCDAQGVYRLRQLPPAPNPLTAKVDGDNQAVAEHKERFNQVGWLSLHITQDGKWVHEHQISRKEFFDSQGIVRVVVPNDRNPLAPKITNGTIFGEVVDSTGLPVKEYHVTLRYRTKSLAVNDPEGGRFQWDKTLNPESTYEVRIFTKGFAPATRRITPRTTNQAKPERIELTPHKSGEFLLLDAQTHKPLPNISVVTGISKRSGWNYVEWNDLKNYADGHHSLENVLRVTSNTDGRITVPEGDEPATLIILASGYARMVVAPLLRPAPNDAGLIPIPLQPAASIHGVAVPSSRLSQQADGLSLHFVSTDRFDHMLHGLKRDAKGECLIDSLAAGDYFVTLMHSEGNTSTSCWTKKIALKAGEQLKVPLGELTGMLTLSGSTALFTQVRLTRKQSLTGLDVDPAKDADDVTRVATISDVDGYFELDHVQPGSYQIELGGLGHSHRIRFAGGKGPTEILLSKDTHIDYVTGKVTPPEAAVDSPAKKKSPSE
ncbi:hypothetical protein LBMAG52_15520 [Planctomycetia bacterium]|nr:hypothetical protein LBMAG52_15520 [Planctomycetia bacterium]